MMPTFEITSPDGRKYRITAPEGATQEQVLAYAQSNAPKEQAATAPADIYKNQAESDTFGQNVLASFGGAMKGLDIGVRQRLGKATPEEVQQWKDSMAGLWSTGGGKIGTIAGGAAVAAPTMMIPGANTLVGSAAIGAGLGALQPTGQDESVAGNMAWGGAGGAVGKVGGDLLGSMMGKYSANKAAQLAAAKSNNAVRDALVGRAQTAGYTLPPTQVNPTNPGAANRLLEGLSGKIQTAQRASIKNQEVTDRLAKQALALPDDVPLSPQSIKTVRDTAGKFYETLKGVGDVPTDSVYTKTIGDIATEYRSLAEAFPSQANAKIEQLLTDLERNSINSGHAVELVKRLRFDGFKNINTITGEPEKIALGRVQLAAQNAIEDQLDRHLANTGNAEFLAAFRKARTLIAKSYTVENALEKSTGKVVAAKIGKEFSKGRPLTGELATIGKVAESFPKAVQNVNSSMPGLSPLDAGASLVTLASAVGSGNPQAAWLALAPLARPVAREAILSKPWQRFMAQPSTYQQGLLSRNIGPIANSEYLKMLEQSLGVSVPFGQ